MVDNSSFISKFPYTSKYCRDLTLLSEEDLLLPKFFCRDDILQKVISVLNRKIKNNIIIIGEPGVGKTSIVESLAKKIAYGEIPSLMDKHIFSLDIVQLIAGSKLRGQLEERLVNFTNEIRSSNQIILFIDEIHNIAINNEGAINIANMLKPMLSKNEIQCIGTTTYNEYTKYFVNNDPALTRRFQTLVLEEPDVKETIQILKNIKSSYENYHNVKYNSLVIKACVELSQRYINNKNFPDKAIDILDEVGAYVSTKNSKKNTKIYPIIQKIIELKKHKSECIKAQNFEEAAVLRDQIKSLRVKLLCIKNNLKTSIKTGFVNVDDVINIVSQYTKIPYDNILSWYNENASNDRLNKIRDKIYSDIVGQEQAINSILKTITSSQLSKNNSKITKSFLIVGPKGCGKTQFVKLLAKYYVNIPEAFIKIDMDDYKDQYNTLSRLVGAPPGYVGFEKGGILSSTIQKYPYCIILFDNMTPNNKEVRNIIIQMMENGYIINEFGNKVSCKNVMIFITISMNSNTINNNVLGFNDNMITNYQRKQKIDQYLEKIFGLEFINCISNISVFEQLTEDNIKSISKICSQKLINKIGEKGYKIVLSDSVTDFITKISYIPSFGAKYVEYNIKQYLESSILEYIMTNKVKSKQTIYIDVENDKIVFKTLTNNNSQNDEQH